MNARLEAVIGEADRHVLVAWHPDRSEQLTGWEALRTAATRPRLIA
jgi:hypothetical protein